MPFLGRARPQRPKIGRAVRASSSYVWLEDGQNLICGGIEDMYRKNVASQNLGFRLVNATTGAALTGATVTAYRSIDGGAQASATGSVSELGNGQYNLALSQADTNGNQVSLLFVATSAVPVEKTIVTTAANPTDTVRFGMTSLPNAAAEAAGGLYTRGTGAGQINQAANGQSDSNAVAISGDSTAADNAESLFDGTGYNNVLVKLIGLVPESGTVGSTGNTTTTIHLPDLTDYLAGELNNRLLMVLDSSEGLYYSRWIEDWNTTTNLATVASLPVTTGSADSWWLLAARRDGTIGAGGIVAASFGPGAIDAAAIAANAIGASELAADAASEIAAAIWDLTRSGHATAGTFGEYVPANVALWLGTAPSTPTVAGVPNVNVKTWNDLSAVALPLVPTVAGRTLDVSATGEAGIDWANVGSPTTTLTLTGTTIATTQKVDVETVKTRAVTAAGAIVVGGFVGQDTAALGVNGSGHVNRVVLVDTLTTYTNNTPQTGDAYAQTNSGTFGLAVLKGYVDDIGVAGAGLTAVPWNAAWDAEVQSEVADALDTAVPSSPTANSVNERLKTMDDADMPGSLTTLLARITATLFSGITSLAQWLGLMAGKQVGNTTARIELRATGAGSGTFDETTDSGEAIRDRGDAAWVTATGFSTHTAADVGGVVTADHGAGSYVRNTEPANAPVPTAAENADKLLGRSLAGGADGGRTVQDALRLNRNRWTRTATTLTVYAEDDLTIAWQSVIVSGSLSPVSSSDPA